ncbi:MAG: ATP-binding protein [Candidatus Aminicenantes bacterium]|nr:ATP-binding protein [Candidatus Aminicenantes bacterium]
MTKDELKLILQQGEGYNIEFKKSISKDIVQEITAFVNAAGGVLIVGIDDRNEVVGLTLKRIREKKFVKKSLDFRTLPAVAYGRANRLRDTENA